MPFMNGVQLIAEIKKANPSIRAIIMTGYGSTEAVIEAMHTGVSDFITKPFKLEHMKKVIRKVLSEGENTGTNAHSEKNAGMKNHGRVRYILTSTRIHPVILCRTKQRRQILLL